LRQAQGQGEEHRVPRRDVGDGNSLPALGGRPVLGNRQLRGQRRAADGTKIHGHHPHVAHALGKGHHPGAIELHRVPLAVLHQETRGVETVGTGQGQTGGGVEAAGEQHHRPGAHSDTGRPRTALLNEQETQPASQVVPSTSIWIAFTPHTSRTFHCPGSIRGGRRLPPTGGMPPSKSTSGGGQVVPPSAMARAWDSLSTARVFRSWTTMSGGSMEGQPQLTKTRGLLPVTSITWPTMVPYSVPEPSIWVRKPASKGGIGPPSGSWWPPSGEV